MREKKKEMRERKGIKMGKIKSATMKLRSKRCGYRWPLSPVSPLVGRPSIRKSIRRRSWSVGGCFLEGVLVAGTGKYSHFMAIVVREELLRLRSVSAGCGITSEHGRIDTSVQHQRDWYDLIWRMQYRLMDGCWTGGVERGGGGGGGMDWYEASVYGSQVNVG